jgi:probable FeS assembly SUF system protein SufT
MSVGQELTLETDLDAIQVPAGTHMLLPAGTHVIVTQALGGSYTLMTDWGYLVRIGDQEASKLGLAVPERDHGVDAEMPLGDLIRRELSTCYDPEIPVNIVELGLVYGTQVTAREDGQYRVAIQMTLTAPGCGMGEVLVSDIDQKVKRLPRVAEVSVDLTFDPPWTPERMSEAAKLELGML